MSFGDIVRDVVGDIVDAVFGPQRPPPKPEELVPPGSPPPPPPPGPGQPGSGLDRGHQKALDEYKSTFDSLGITDERIRSELVTAFANNDAARDRVLALLAEIQTKRKALAPSMDDPAVFREYTKLVDHKLGQIEQVIADAKTDAKTKAAIIDGLAAEYGGKPSPDAGKPDEPAPKKEAPAQDPAPAPTPGAADPAAAAVSPAALGPTAADPNAIDPLVDPLAGMPLGAGDPMASMMPALAGLSGLPGMASGLMGAGMPLNGLGSALGQIPALANGLADRADPQAKPDSGFVDDKPGDDKKDVGELGKEFTDDKHNHEPGQDCAHCKEQADKAVTDKPASDKPPEGKPADAVPASTPGAPPPPTEAGRAVNLPDGTTVSAPSESAAKAMRAVLSGTGVTAAYEAVGVHVAPPGTPVTNPVDPAQLPPGALARFEAREPVMAMGNGKIYLDGQLQPLGALPSGGDFLGWTMPAPAPAVPAPVPGAPAPATRT